MHQIQMMHCQTADEWVTFRSLGDINADGYINSKDLTAAQAAFGSTPGSPNWNPYADINGDGIVDGKDISVVAKNQGLNIWAYFGLKKPTPWWIYAVAAVGTVIIVGGIAYAVTRRR